jgi:NAD(P)-dependent dehydrogenase (short-subunit alcohol dehydrogenase family)
MPPSEAWTADDLPNLSGKRIVVTGGNSGIGFQAAREFANKGASVVLACRSIQKARVAASQTGAAHAKAAIEVSELDLANLESARNFARAFRAQHRDLHVLWQQRRCYGAAVPPNRGWFREQFGTNHLGFALTCLLLETLLRTDGARVVTVSSGAHWMGRIQFEDLQWERGYSEWLAYGQSKVANLLFTFELERRAEQAGVSLKSVACHPGYAATKARGGPTHEGILDARDDDGVR